MPPSNPARPRHGRYRAVLLSLMLGTATAGCSVQQFAVDRLGDALASGGTVFATDDDPTLVRDASPFSLKLIESLLAESPHHTGLLLAASRGFTQYAYAFVLQEADETEAHDLDRAFALRERARRLFARARDHGLRGLETRHPGLLAALRATPDEAGAALTAADIDQLYWAAAAWGAMISLSKDNPDAVADLPLVSALLDRALELDADYDAGALHTLMISYAMARPDAGADRVARAEAHYRRAIELGASRQAGPYVAFAEAVAQARQDRAAFVHALETALAIDEDAAPQWRLANLVSQRRARWLLTQTDSLFVE